MLTDQERSELTEKARFDDTASQRLFESLFPEGHAPKIDPRTPVEVESGLSMSEVAELRG